MTEKEFFEKLKAEGLNGNDYAFKALFNIDTQGNIISSKEGIWFDLRYGDAPFIFSTSIPRAELEKFTPNPITEQTFLNQLKGSDKPSPFTSKGYPFSKELSSYNPTSLGRAFFSDGVVKKYFNDLNVYDNISTFLNLKSNLKDEPIYFKKRAVSLSIYTADNEQEISDKYKRLNLFSDEIGVFALEKKDTIDFKIKLGTGLLDVSRFQTSSELKNYTKSVKKEELKNSTISTKKILDLFKEDEKPLLDDLNTYTKEDFQKYQNPAISTFVKKDFYKSTYRPPMKVKTVDVTLGMFFDGTGNNRFNTELIYNQHLDKDSKLQIEEVKKLKNKTTKHPKKPKVNVDVKNYMIDLEGSTSYLNPYSNIVLLHDLYQSNSSKFNKNTTLNQNVVFKQYVQGIGTKVDLDQNGIATEYYEDDILGSASGRGERGIIARVEQGIEDSVLQLKKFLEQHNREIRILTIDVFGFSRGAAAARHFINEVLKPEIKANTQKMLNQQGQTEFAPAQPKSGLLGSEFNKQGINIPAQINIRFSGLFETVVSDSSEKGYFTRKFIELPEKFSVPSNVLYERVKGYEKINTSLENLKSKVMHIIAMDEYRENFPLTVGDAPNTYNLYLYGSHSDIGGGYAKTDYNTIIGFKDIGNKTELLKYEKIADSYRRRFAFQKNVKGIWEFKKGQITLQKTDTHYSKPHINSSNPPKKLSEHYIVIDKRFISNKVQLVSLNAMMQYALTEKVPFQSDFKKLKNINEQFYEVPKSVKYFMNYYNGILEMVKKQKDDKLNLAIEDYYPLFQNYIHISSNYNKSALFETKGKELLPGDFYVNEPTENNKRKYLKSK